MSGGTSGPGGTPAPSVSAATGVVLAEVMLDRAPLLGARLVLKADPIHFEGRTDSTGTFRFDDVPQGEYRLEAIGLGDDTRTCTPAGACIARYPAIGEARQVTVSAGATNREVFDF